ncbi:MAG: EFR1 family ferrodoxin [Treponema sp.]|nr:EFR1 family ferrodoxin [Treponema sp.]
MENIVFYFSGTGNCLKAAKDISKELANCDIRSMAKPFDFTKQYDSIGFVYPTYFYGLPKRVIEFIKNINLEDNKKAYFYAVTVHGGFAGNAPYQLYELLLKQHGIKLAYIKTLKMFQNYVIMFEMSKKADLITKKSNRAIIPIINSIKAKKSNRVNKLTKIMAKSNRDFLEKVSTMDKDYSVNNNCTGCTICEKVCPVKNIEMINNKPEFRHHCENCLACIHYCPQRAINYKNVTQNRKRYTNPEISYRELAEFNNK